MLKVTVSKPDLREINFTDKKGNPGKLLIQTAYLHAIDQDGTPAAFPDKFEIILPRGVVTPFAPGQYELHPSAISVDSNGRLSCAPRLTPIKRAA